MLLCRLPDSPRYEWIYIIPHIHKLVHRVGDAFRRRVCHKAKLRRQIGKLPRVEETCLIDLETQAAGKLDAVFRARLQSVRAPPQGNDSGVTEPLTDHTTPCPNSTQPNPTSHQGDAVGASAAAGAAEGEQEQAGEAVGLPGRREGGGRGDDARRERDFLAHGRRARGGHGRG